MVMEFSLQGLTDALDGVTGGLTSAVNQKTTEVKTSVASCLPTVANVDARETAIAADGSGIDARDASEPAAKEPAEEKLLAYSDEPTELYNRLKSSDWSGAIASAQRNPLEAKTWIVEKNTDGTTRWELLPLHLACENQPPVEGEFLLGSKSRRWKLLCYDMCHDMHVLYATHISEPDSLIWQMPIISHTFSLLLLPLLCTL